MFTTLCPASSRIESCQAWWCRHNNTAAWEAEAGGRLCLGLQSEGTHEGRVRQQEHVALVPLSLSSKLKSSWAIEISRSFPSDQLPSARTYLLPPKGPPLPKRAVTWGLSVRTHELRGSWHIPATAPTLLPFKVCLSQSCLQLPQRRKIHDLLMVCFFLAQESETSVISDRAVMPDFPNQLFLG